MEIIDEAINIVKKGIKEEKNFNKDIIKIFLRKTKDNDYMNYVIKDIIHNNIYSVVVSPLIKDKISSVESKVKNIEDNTRRMIVRNILQKKNIYDIFEDDPSNIGSSICKHYLVMLRGEHQDIYKDYTKYKTFSGLDFDTLKNILKDCNINNQNIPHIYSFVLDGYITNPDIVNYMISKI